MMNNRPVALTIAGSDNSAGAGIQADLKTFTALGVYGLTALTCVVAEVPGKVSAIAPVPPEVVAEQVRLCLAAYPVRAIKTGMLYSREAIEATLGALRPALSGPERPALVVDPVMVASSGDPLLQPDAVAAYKEDIFPLATLVTPNLDEAAALLGRPIPTPEAMREAGHALCERYGVAFLLKGGHLPGEALDCLFTPEGQMTEWCAPRVADVDTHGTGCTFSAAIAAGLAAGLPLGDAVAQGKAFVAGAIERHFRWVAPQGGETHALDHRLPPLAG